MNAVGYYNYKKNHGPLKRDFQQTRTDSILWVWGFETTELSSN